MNLIDNLNNKFDFALLAFLFQDLFDYTKKDTLHGWELISKLTQEYFLFSIRGFLSFELFELRTSNFLKKNPQNLRKCHKIAQIQQNL